MAAAAKNADDTSALAKIHNLLLRNTVEIHTTPKMYPVCRTKTPVVVVDEWGASDGAFDQEGPLYVAVTPGATIYWALCTKRE